MSAHSTSQYQLPFFRAMRLRSPSRPQSKSAFLFDPSDRPLLRDLSRRLGQVLPQSQMCTHLAGNGGLKATMRQFCARLSASPKNTSPKNTSPQSFVYRTDVHGYYEHIDAGILMDKACKHTSNRDTQNLLNQYLHMSVEYGGTFTDAPKGLRAGGSPSPILAAFYLYDLDCELENLAQSQSGQAGDLFYRRYMDDLIVVSNKRGVFKRATPKSITATIQRHFKQLGMASHLEKTQIGRIGDITSGVFKDGVVFLGYLVSLTGIKLAPITRLKNVQAKHAEKYRQQHAQCKAKQRLARRVFAGGQTIATDIPSWSSDRAYLTVTPQMQCNTWITDRLRAYETRFKAWAKGGFENEEVNISA